MSAEWGYGQTNGPRTWSENYPAAGGDLQSPVDISSTYLQPLHSMKKLSWRYVPEHSETLHNTGHGWQIKIDGKGSELVGGPLEDKYIIREFHCHWGSSDDQGSEHTVNGKPFSGELHLVHHNSKYDSFEEACRHPDGVCVLAVFLRLGKLHYELNKIVPRLAAVQHKGQQARLTIPVDPGCLIPGCSSYWTYQGSFTTPPCTECVTWIVFQEPIQLSREQLTAFRNLKSFCSEDSCPADEFEGHIWDNFRPTHPLGKRNLRRCSQ